MSEYQCISHDNFALFILPTHPKAWLACESPERKPDVNMLCCDKCEKCNMMKEAARRIGILPTEHFEASTKTGISESVALKMMLKGLFGDA